jgi:hypothetical protein
MASKNALAILVGTRKGAFILTADKARGKWNIEGPHFLGQIVNHLVLDPRGDNAAGKTLLAASRAGHLGPTVFRSTDFGKTWKEAKKPPQFPPAPEGKTGLAVEHVFWLTPGHASEPGVWYAGSSPQGLFRSDDDGVTWASVDGFNLNPDRSKWCGDPGQDGTPDGPKLHSINVDPFNAKHLYIGMSSGGVFESYDRGASWKPLNRGVKADFLPDPDAAYGHDPHCLRVHPKFPDRVYHQNHCGIYALDRKANRWNRIGDNMPKDIGDIGFPLVLHPRNPDVLWVFPMDGTTVWPRVSLQGKPAVYGSRDAGKTWKRYAKGLPKAQAWFTVKRQAMCADSHDPVGLYFGTTSGEVWASFDEGDNWCCLIQHLPHIYSLEAAAI